MTMTLRCFTLIRYVEQGDIVMTMWLTYMIASIQVDGESSLNIQFRTLFSIDKKSFQWRAKVEGKIHLKEDEIIIRKESFARFYLHLMGIYIFIFIWMNKKRKSLSASENNAPSLLCLSYWNDDDAPRERSLISTIIFSLRFSQLLSSCFINFMNLFPPLSLRPCTRTHLGSENFQSWRGREWAFKSNKILPYLAFHSSCLAILSVRIHIRRNCGALLLLLRRERDLHGTRRITLKVSSKNEKKMKTHILEFRGNEWMWIRRANGKISER